MCPQGPAAGFLRGARHSEHSRTEGVGVAALPPSPRVAAGGGAVS
jgi:hypothetical protein